MISLSWVALRDPEISTKQPLLLLLLLGVIFNYLLLLLVAVVIRRLSWYSN